MQGVHLKPRIHGAHRRDQRLAGHVSAECPLEVTGFGAEDTAAVDVDLELLEVEDLFDRHEMCLPAAFGEPMRGRNVLDVDADHRLPEPA